MNQCVTAGAQPLELKYHHVGVSVPDLEASIAWYGRVLEFELEARGRLPAADVQVALLRRGTLRIELFQPERGLPLPAARRYPDEDILTHGNKHVAFAVKNVDAAAAELRRRGADGVVAKHMPQASVLFMRDNAGNLIELFEQPDLWER